MRKSKKTLSWFRNKSLYFLGVFNQGAYRAGHYYSPVPSRKDLKRRSARQAELESLPDIDLRTEEQWSLLNELSQYYEEIPFTEQAGGKTRYYFDQGWFCHSDAIFLYCLIRHCRWNRIVEVGSGYSSAVMLDTLERHAADDFSLTCIDPFPERLNALLGNEKPSGVTVIPREVQDVDPEVFRSLQAGDLLFIDSSHVVKYKSDLHHLLFEILPDLPGGVFVHFHDIFFPFEYPEHYLRKGKYWNECYLLRAFLTGNTDWKILFFNDYVNRKFPDFITNQMPLCRENFGGSLYLQKK